MRSRLALLLVASLVAAATSPAGAATSNRTPVTSTLATAAGGYPLEFGGDGLGSYIASRTVASEIQGAAGGNDWYLNTEARSPTRTIRLDFTHPAYGSDPGVAPFVSGLIPANPILQCGEEGIDLFAIPAGGTADCHLIVRFTYGGVNYRLGFNSNSQWVPAGQPQGDMARVRCLAASKGLCSKWHVEPTGTTLLDADPNPKNVGMLFLRDTNVLLGYFYLSFSIDFAR